MADPKGAAFWTYRSGISLTLIGSLFFLGHLVLGNFPFPPVVYLAIVVVGILLLVVSRSLRQRAKSAPAPPEGAP